MKITIIGTGYVGLVTGACLAEMGNDVLCLDIDAREVRALLERRRHSDPRAGPRAARASETSRAGRLAVHHRRRSRGRARRRCSSSPSARRPTRTARPTCSHVLAAARNIGRRMTDYKVVVDKSTVPVGTADRVRAAIREELAGAASTVEFCVVSNPEFLKEGAAVDDFMRPDRIVVGTDDERAVAADARALRPFMRNHDRLLVMDVRWAELTKYAANAMLATRISFMNELANLAERLGADIEPVRQGIGSDPRIGTSFLYAGFGYGGSCFPKDVKALSRTGEEHGLRAADAAGGRVRQRAAEAGAGRQDRRTLRRRPVGQHASPSGALPSSPTPTTCARRPAECSLKN